MKAISFAGTHDGGVRQVRGALLASTLCLGGAVSLTIPAYAQEASPPSGEQIVVTGSRVKRDSFQGTSPVEVMGQEAIEQTGAPTITDIVKNLTINTGSEFNESFDTARQTTGTSQVNLRGLGLNSTLTLVNGRRTTLSATAASDGSTFVDINQYPLLMVERIEVLKDGAAAIYGSDAVAGVFNIITRNKFDGLEFDASYQTTTEDSQGDFTLSGAFGVEGDRGRFQTFITYFDRTPLLGVERDWYNTVQTSGFGFVPTLVFTTAPTSGPFAGTGITGSVQDPDCGVAGSVPSPDTGNPSAGVKGSCRANFAPAFGLVPQEKRLTSFTSGSYDITDNLEFFGEVSFARNRAVGAQSSPPAILRQSILVRADHPANPHGVDVIYLGRVGPVRVSPRPISNDYWRVATGARYEISQAWDAEFSYVYSQNDFSVTNDETSIDALTVPSGNPAIPLAIRPDYNPFGSQYTTGPFNDPALQDEIEGTITNTAKSSLQTLEASLSGDLFELPGGNLGVAFGVQYREDSLEIDLDDQVNRGVLAFDGKSPDTPRTTRGVLAGYAEAVVPVADALELQLALRHENYEGSAGSTTNPKVAVSWSPTDAVTLRGSYGTSFRAPSLFQTNVGGQSETVLAFDPFAGNPAGTCNLGAPSVAFPAGTAVGNPNLKPESARNFNAGFVARPAGGLRFSVDYWRFNYNDIIVKENAQQIINNDCLDDGIANDPRITRGPGGQVRAVEVEFINASSLQTDGFDFGAAYEFGVGGIGDLAIDLRATYINKYSFRLTEGGNKIDGAGSRNFLNPFRSTPEWRGNASLFWSSGRHKAGATVRYIDSYLDDNAKNAPIDSQITLDLQYSYDLGELLGRGRETRLTIGAINVTDEDPPVASGIATFDTSVHDPRGRLVYISLRQSL